MSGRRDVEKGRFKPRGTAARDPAWVSKALYDPLSVEAAYQCKVVHTLMMRKDGFDPASLLPLWDCNRCDRMYIVQHHDRRKRLKGSLGSLFDCI